MLAPAERERILARLVENAPDALFRIDLSEPPLVEYVSPAVTAISGYTPSEFYADPGLMRSIVHPEDTGLFAQMQRRPLETHPLRIIRKDGTIARTECRFTIVAEAGAGAAAEGVVRDVSARTLTEQSNQAQRRAAAAEYAGALALLDTLVDAAPVGFAVFDTELRYVRINDSLAATNEELSAAAHIGKTFAELGLETIDVAVTPLLQQVLESGEPILDLVLQLEVPALGEREHLLNIYPVKTPEGVVSAIGAIVVDVTDRVRAERDRHEAERRYRSMMEQLPLVTYSQTMDERRELYVSPQIEQLTGFTPQEHENDPGLLTQYIHPDDRVEQQRAWQEALDRGDAYSAEYRLLHRDGHVVWVLDEGGTVEDESGRPVLFQGFLLDVTERKVAEEQARESVATLSILIEAAPVAIYSLDLNALVTTWNPAAEKIFGWSKAEAVGTALLTVRDEDRDEFRSLLRVCYAQGGFSDVPAVRRHKDGSLVDASISMAPTLDAAGEVVGVIVVVADITQRLKAERSLRDLNTTLSTLIEASPLAILALDDEQKIRMWNRAAEEIFGWTEGEVLGRPNPIVPEDGREEHVALLQRTLAGEKVRGLELRRKTKDGSLLDVRLSIAALYDESGRAVGAVALVEDVSHQVQLADRYRQAQKLEEIGQLAGGIAHDFNNIMTAISGYAGFLMRRLESNSKLRREVEEIRRAAERGSGLTRQLLAFSRRQQLDPRLVFLNDIVSGLEHMLQQLIGEHIELKVESDPALEWAFADRGQLEQVLVNLVVNAKDAMPDGGELTVTTRNVTLAETAAAELGIEPGKYVVMAVSDTGEGMSDAVQARLFEPFYTTKEGGKGTGLGLPTVYGIVSQSGGGVGVASTLGAGSTFTIYLPRSEAGTADDRRGPAASLFRPEQEPAVGTETLMLVEDDGMVRSLAQEMLSDLGYTVLVASDGLLALEVCAAHEGEIDLIVTDVVMPKMGGRELSEQLALPRPGTRFLFVSGYNDDYLLLRGALPPGSDFLEKPFTEGVLAAKVRTMLDFPNGAPP